MRNQCENYVNSISFKERRGSHWRIIFFSDWYFDSAPSTSTVWPLYSNFLIRTVPQIRKNYLLLILESNFLKSYSYEKVTLQIRRNQFIFRHTQLCLEISDLHGSLKANMFGRKRLLTVKLYVRPQKHGNHGNQLSSGLYDLHIISKIRLSYNEAGSYNSHIVKTKI